MDGTTTPSWDELLDAGTYAAKEAAAIRGVHVSAATKAASRRKRQWRNVLFKAADADIRKVAKKALPVEEAAEILGISVKSIYKRAASMRGLVVYRKQLCTTHGLKKVQAAEMEAIERAKEELAAQRAARLQADEAARAARAAQRAAASREAKTVTRKAPVVRLSANPEAIQRYLAKAQDYRRRVAA